jgi:hypothetical protein
VLVGRRESQRHRLDIAARIVSSSASLRVQLEDISLTGACVRLMVPQKIADGRLSWLNFNCFARVVWNDGLRCGLVFDEEINGEWLKQTVDFGRLANKDKGDRFVKLASAWVHGPGDW